MMKRPLRPRIGYDEQIFPKPGDYDALKSEEWDMEQEQQLQDWLKPQEQGHPKIRERPVAYRQSKGSRTGHSLPKEKLGGIGLPSWLTKSLEDVYREKYGGRYPGLAENVAAGVGTGLKAIGLPKHIAETTGRNITSLAEDWTGLGGLTATEEYGPLGALAALPLVGGKAKKAAKLARGLGEVSEHLPNVERPLASVTDVEKPRPVKSNGSVKKAGPMNVEAPVGSVKDVTGPSTAGGLGGSSKPKGPMNVEVPSGSTVDQTDTAPAMGVKGSVKSKASNTEIPVSSKVDTVAPQGLGIRAYHGSPHSFEEFDISKIGTGEGAQAYGHGLYFAENEGVARSYRDALATDMPVVVVNGKETPLENLTDAQAMALRLSFSKNPEADLATSEYPQAIVNEARDLWQKGAVSQKDPGHMYEVNIAADPDAFLDWDKPAGGLGRERVLELLDKGFDNSPDAQDLYRKVKSGGELPSTQDLYDALANPFDKGRETATENLKQAGIPGIKYLDQGSRVTSGGELLGVEKTPQGWQAKIKVTNRQGVGIAGGPTDMFTTSKPYTTEAEARKWAEDKIKSGSRNYVVFDPKIISIVRKYGLAAAIASGLITEEMGRQMQAQGEL